MRKPLKRLASNNNCTVGRRINNGPENVNNDENRPRQLSAINRQRYRSFLAASYNVLPLMGTVMRRRGVYTSRQSAPIRDNFISRLFAHPARQRYSRRSRFDRNCTAVRLLRQWGQDIHLDNTSIGGHNRGRMRIQMADVDNDREHQRRCPEMVIENGMLLWLRPITPPPQYNQILPNEQINL